MKTNIIPCRFVILLLLIFFITCSKDNPTEPEKPQLNINLTSFIFTKNVTTQLLIITNNGSRELTWEITDKADWLTVSKSSGKITTVSDTVIMTADINQQQGTYQDTVKIISNDGNENIDVLLHLETWISRRNMPTARYSFTTCVLDEKIYAIGGRDGENDLTAVEAYDPATNKWTQKTAMPTARNRLASCILDGKIYAIGGSINHTIISLVEVYDPITDNWTSGVALPLTLSLLSCSVVDGKIYAIGGSYSWSEGGEDHPTYEFDPNSGQWTEKTKMPTPRSGHGACVIDGKIYTFGGIGFQLHFSDLEVYDPETDSWDIKEPMQRSRFYFGASDVNGKIYAIGGSGYPYNLLSSVEEYDPSIDTWVNKSNIPTPRWGLSSSAVNGQIFVIGGSITSAWQGEAYSIVEAYDP